MGRDTTKVETKRWRCYELAAADIFCAAAGYILCKFEHYLLCNCSSESLCEPERNRCCGWLEHPRSPGGASYIDRLQIDKHADTHTHARTYVHRAV